MDYFDASINRIGAYVVGIRSTQKAMLQALLEPTEKLREYEKETTTSNVWPIWKS